MADRFSDFDLSIWKEGDVYKAEVRGSPAGNCPRTSCDWPFKEDNQHLLCKLEQAILREHGWRGPRMCADEFGAAVFDAVFRGAPMIQDRYTNSLHITKDEGHAMDRGLRGLLTGAADNVVDPVFPEAANELVIPTEDVHAANAHEHVRRSAGQRTPVGVAAPNSWSETMTTEHRRSRR